MKEKAKERAERKEKETEGVLKLYTQLQSIEIKLRRTGNEKYDLASSEDYSQIGGGNTNSIYSETEQAAVRKVAAQQNLPGVVNLIRDIEKILDSLTSEEYQAIRHKFFKGMQVVNIERELEQIFDKSFSRSTVYRRLSSAKETLKDNNLWTCYPETAETVYRHRGKLHNIEDETLLKHI